VLGGLLPLGGLLLGTAWHLFGAVAALCGMWPGRTSVRVLRPPAGCGAVGGARQCGFHWYVPCRHNVTGTLNAMTAH
jgi:hypothetical protein